MPLKETLEATNDKELENIDIKTNMKNNLLKAKNCFQGKFFVCNF